MFRLQDPLSHTHLLELKHKGNQLTFTTQRPKGGAGFREKVTQRLKCLRGTYFPPSNSQRYSVSTDFPFIVSKGCQQLPLPTARFHQGSRGGICFPNNITPCSWMLLNLIRQAQAIWSSLNQSWGVLYPDWPKALMACSWRLGGRLWWFLPDHKPRREGFTRDSKRKLSVSYSWNWDALIWPQYILG